MVRDCQDRYHDDLLNSLKAGAGVLVAEVNPAVAEGFDVCLGESAHGFSQSPCRCPSDFEPHAPDALDRGKLNEGLP